MGLPAFNRLTYFWSKSLIFRARHGFFRLGNYVSHTYRIFSSPRRTTVETLTRCFQATFLLRAGPTANARILGCLAKAQQLYDVDLHAFVFMSGHYHLCATYDEPEQMALFHGHLNTNLSKEIGRLRDWPGSLFHERYSHVEISDETESQLGRLKYILAQGCKEGLVASPLDWPGPSSTRALITGEPIYGEWIDRTAYGKALRRGEDVSEQDFAEILEVKLSPLPALAHLSDQSYRQVISGLVRQIEEDTAAMHRIEGTRPAGIASVLSRNPKDRPKELKRSPRPWLHAHSNEVREAMRTALLMIVAQYAVASGRFRAGGRHAKFPLHTFPPGLPFVRNPDQKPRKRQAFSQDVELLEPG